MSDEDNMSTNVFVKVTLSGKNIKMGLTKYGKFSGLEVLYLQVITSSEMSTLQSPVLNMSTNVKKKTVG